MPGKLEDNAAQIVRAIRKYFDLSQEELASKLSVNQSSISRIEKGLHKPPLDLWFDICNFGGIEASSFKTGVAELHLPSLSLESAHKNSGGFKIAEKYKYLSGSTTRTALPFINSIRENLGDDFLKGMFKDFGIDPDYFVMLNLPLNINLIHDLINILIDKRIMTSDQMIEFKSIIDPSIHGANSQGYFRAKNTKELLARLVKNAKRYEINFDWSFEEEGDNLLINIDKNDHMNEFRVSKVIEEAAWAYRKKYVETFQSFGEQSNTGLVHTLKSEDNCHSLRVEL